MKFLNRMLNQLRFRSDMAGFLVIWGALFGGIPLLMMPFFIVITGVERLICERVEPTQVSCQLTQSNFLGLRKEPGIWLGKVKGARVDQKTNSEGSESYQVVVLTNNGDIYLNNQNIDSASEINSFVSNTDKKILTLNYDSRKELFFVVPFLLLFIVPGFGAIFYAIRTELKLR